MSLYKLTEEVWWGDRHAVAECADKVGSVINVAHNPELAPGKTRYNPLVLPGEVPYFRLGRHDSNPCDTLYIHELSSIIDICVHHQPLLVHCYVGSHRSPIAAVFAAFLWSDCSLSTLHDLMATMRELKPGFRVDKYHESLYKHMVDMAEE